MDLAALALEGEEVVFCFLGGDLALASLVDARLLGAVAGTEPAAGAAREDRRGIAVSSEENA